MQLELNPEERDLLEKTLQSYLSDLRYEIGNTDSFDYRGELKHTASVLNQILGQLQEKP